MNVEISIKKEHITRSYTPVYTQCMSLNFFILNQH